MSKIVAILKHEDVILYVAAAAAIGFLTFALT
jgi:hypothetical protein